MREFQIIKRLDQVIGILVAYENTSFLKNTRPNIKNYLETNIELNFKL